MSKKYISEIQNDNFIFPNNDPWEYGVEIIHDINDYSVTGSVTNFVMITTGTSVNITFDYAWARNNAESFITDSDLLSVLSVHMMEPTTQYYKPWRLVGNVTNPTTYLSNVTGSASFTITPEQMGVSALTNGLYNFEIRFIGHRAIFPVCISANLATFPTPTPTPTPPPFTPTPTPTPTATPTPTPNIFFSGATLNITDTGWIKYNSPGGEVYFYRGTLGLYTLPACADCLSFRPGIPYADLASFSIISCGTACP